MKNALQRIALLAIATLSLAACQSTTSHYGMLHLSKSLPAGFRNYGMTEVSAADGHPVRTGDTSTRFEVRDGDCSADDGWSDCANDRERHELKSQIFGGEMWVNWSVYLPEDYPNIYPTKVALGQFHQKRGHVIWMFQNNDGGLWVDRQSNGSTQDEKRILSDAEMRGKWADILVHVRWSPKYNGFFRVYVNGEDEPRYAFAGSTHTNGLSPYFKIGIYRSFMSRYLKYGNSKDGIVPTQIVYYDDIRADRTCSGAASHFDCDKIMAKQAGLPLRDAPTNYERTAYGLKQRFSCWKDAQEARQAGNLPTDRAIGKMVDDLKGDWTSQASKFRIRRFLGAETVNAHEKDLLDLVNYTGKSTDYCTKISGAS